jgi:hypothetical protein
LSVRFDLKEQLNTGGQIDDIITLWKEIIDTVASGMTDVVSSISSSSSSLQQLSSATSINDAENSFPVTFSPLALPQQQLQELHDITNQLFHAWDSFITTTTSALPAWNTPEIILFSTILSFLAVNHVLVNWGRYESPPPSVPYPLQKYDPLSAQIYFDLRPFQVFQRSMLIVTKSLRFALSLLGDRLGNNDNNKWQTNMEQRGRELAELLTQLGPTFIKSTYSRTPKNRRKKNTDRVGWAQLLECHHFHSLAHSRT